MVRVRGKSGVGIDTGIDTIDICNTWLIPPSIDTGIDTSGIKAEPALISQTLDQGSPTPKAKQKSPPPCLVDGR
jgi:hypothetical protein